MLRLWKTCFGSGTVRIDPRELMCEELKRKGQSQKVFLHQNTGNITDSNQKIQQVY